MAKNLKFKIKNAQLAEALELDKKPIEQANLDGKNAISDHSVTDGSVSEKPKVRKATSMPKNLQLANEKPSKEAPAESPAPTTLESKHESKVAKVEEALFKPLPSVSAAEEKTPSKVEVPSTSHKESTVIQQEISSNVEHKQYKESQSYTPRENRPYTPNGQREDRPYTPRENRPYTPSGQREDRPYTPRENRPYTPGGQREDRPYTPRENRPYTPGGQREDRPHTPRENRPYTPRENRPYTPGGQREDRPHTPRENRPYTPRENRPYTPRENRPYTPGGQREDRPYTPREDRSSSPRENRPYTPGGQRENRPYTPRENRPYTPRENRPYVSNDSKEQGQDQEFRQPREDREQRPFFREQREGRPFRSDQRESSFNRPLATKMDFTPPVDLKGEKKNHKQDHPSSEDSLKKTPQKDFKEQKPAKKQPLERSFDSRDRLGLRADEGDSWKRKKAFKMKPLQKEEQIIRPTSLKVTLPILLKDLAAEMKYKVSDIIAKLFKQGVIVTLNDVIDDETLAQLIGLEFGCEIQIDRSEQERLNITEQTIREEIDSDNSKNLKPRAPVVAFMGHVDHGKTSLIDAIRKSNVAASEAGAITQHIGAFRTKTEGGDITILDTPGHEAFSAMRTRGASLTDVIVIVIAGDEGIKAQTDEAIQQAKNANVPIIVALNKCDKSNFKPEDVYRQLSERELLPEAWGGSTITVNCSATTKQGIKELLEMILLQSELLELKSNHQKRARGTVIESEIQKGLGATATLLIQNGCLKLGDALVIDHVYGRIKTMHDEHGKSVKEALPSYPVRITGLSELPVAGCEFIVVSNEKEARKLTEDRLAGKRRDLLNQPSSLGLESLLQRNAEKQEKKTLNVIIKADVQGSVEAIKTSLGKIKSKKAELNILYAEVGEISESDIKRSSTANATIIGFHTSIESHAESFIRELQVQVFNFDVIYHLVDKVKSLMTDLLDKIRVETQVGNALVQATFKSSQLGVIAGCLVNEGFIKRSNLAKVVRNKEIVWQGDISSLKRVQEDVREVAKGLECGILLNNFSQIQPGDNIQSFEISYIKQEL